MCRLIVTDYRHCVKTRDRHPEGSKTASTPPYILIADQYYLQITVPISSIYYPIIPYYPHPLRVYIEALELHSRSSRSCIPHTAKAHINTNSFSCIQLQLMVLIARHISCRRATQNTNRLVDNLIRPPPSSQHQERLLEELRLQTSAQRPPPKQLQAHLNDLMSIYRLPAHHALIHNSPYQYHVPLISIWIHGLWLAIFIFTIAENKAGGSLAHNFEGRFSVDVLLGCLPSIPRQSTK